MRPTEKMIEKQAFNCDGWPKWLDDLVEKTMDVADREDMSTEQAIAYAVLSAALAVEAGAVEMCARHVEGMFDEDGFPLHNGRKIAEGIRALTAALAVEAGAVGVKPLEWRWDGHRSVWAADSVIGNYIAWSISGYGYFSYQPAVNDPVKAGSNDEAAKAAAQADYETRIRSALTTYPASSAKPVGVASPAPQTEGK